MHLLMGRNFSWGRFHNMRHFANYMINVKYLADIEHSSPQVIHMPLKGASESLKSWPPLPLIVAQPLKSRLSKIFKPSRVTKVKVGRQLHAP